MKKLVKSDRRFRVVRFGGAKASTNGQFDKPEPEEPVRTYEPSA